MSDNIENKKQANQCSGVGRSPDKILKKLDEKRSEISRNYQLLDELIHENERVRETNDKLQRELDATEEDNKHLWNEIEKLRHGYEGIISQKEHYQQQLQLLKGKFQQVQSGEALAVPEVVAEPSISKFEPAYHADEKLVRNFYSGLDVPDSAIDQTTGEMIHLGGWCFDEKGRAPKRVWVVAGKQEIPCSIGWKRSDVVKEFEGLLNPNLRCGFNVEIAAKQGVNHLNVRAEFVNGAEVSLFHRNIVKVGEGLSVQGQLDQDYESWVELFDTLSADDERQILDHIESLERKPLISVLLPTYNTEARWLSEAIESVRCQLYTNWELCVADDASPEPHVREILEHYAAIDSRIKICIREQNGHISAATNSALEIATGEFCALLDHDDTLPKHAFYHVALELNRHPETDLIFSDEDKIDEEGNRFDPYFKSDWNPELFCSHNCISHLGVYRTSILREIDGFQEDLFGSQDWDLAFRFIQKAGEAGIRHIPRVLYHWRYLESSTAMSIESKPYAVTAGKRAIENYLKNKGAQASVVSGMWPGAFRVKYHLDQSTMASIIIDADCCPEVVVENVNSLIAKTEFARFEVILLASNRFDLVGINKRPNIHVLHLEQSSRAKRLNEGAEKAVGDVLVFLKSDTFISDSEWLSELVAQAVQGETGAVGPWMQYSDGETASGGIVFVDHEKPYMDCFQGNPETDIGHMGRAHLIQRYSALNAACLATMKEVFERIGGFEDREILQDSVFEYCFRLRREFGLFSVWTPYSKVIDRNLLSESDQISVLASETSKDKLASDPYFNPNLSDSDPRFFLSWPPRLENPWVSRS